jgi:hypothetical protein
MTDPDGQRAGATVARGSQVRQAGTDESPATEHDLKGPRREAAG